MLSRVFSLDDPNEGEDPLYAEGLREAVSTALDHGLSSVELGNSMEQQVPPSLLVQARMAARNSVSLDTVFRRYFAGYTLLGDFLIQEVEDGKLLDASSLKALLRDQASVFDHLIATVTAEYARESKEQPSSSEQRRTDLVKRLLTGEPLDTSELAYEFDAVHMGAIAKGPRAKEALRMLATAFDCRPLLVSPAKNLAWCWYGSRRGRALEDISLHLSKWPSSHFLAIGEPGRGFEGWRTTHEQARAALPVALRRTAPVLYADVALLASMLQDNLLARSLNDFFLTPLEVRDDAEALRETLRAYFSANRNVSSAAAALGVTRQTVASRLNTVENCLDRTLQSCAVEVEAALRIEAHQELSLKTK